MKIADFRRTVDSLNWSRHDISGGTKEEFNLCNVPARLNRHIEAVNAAIPQVAPRFKDDLASAANAIGYAEKMIARWTEAQPQQAASVTFKDGRQLFGIWHRSHRSLSTPLFRDLNDAQAHLVCGISQQVDIENAERSSEEVKVRLLGEGESGAVVLTTQASWPEAYVTGRCEA